MIKVKRAYDPPSPTDGHRVLVDRLWPRGLKKSEANIDLWLKEAAPSAGLRNWFGHDPRRWKEFKQRYARELRERQDVLASLRKLERQHGTLTLLFAAKDEKHNNAVVLREVLAHKRANHRK